MTDLTTRELAESFTNGTLVKSNHEDNLKIALWLIAHELDFWTAVSKFKIGLICLMSKIKTPNEISVFYNETSTVFLLKQINKSYQSLKTELAFDVIQTIILKEENLRSREYIKTFYTPDATVGVKAKAVYLEETQY